MRFLILQCLLITVSIASAAEREVAVLTDPIGDDNGNGTLVYPLRDDFQPGDLDLQSLRIVHTAAGYRFEATFKNPIRNPADVAGDVGPEPLSYFARRGFYAFNLDIYIDQDRIKGAGNTYTLPGRHVTIDAAYAWEKAIILTPRPELMQQQLIDALAESEAQNNTAKVAQRLGQSIFFPTDIRVRNRTVSFLVPDSFLAATRPDSDWAITAFVTGAETSIKANLNLLSSAASATDTPSITDSRIPVTSITRTAPLAPTLPASTGTARGSVAERLRQLNDLRKEGLIDEKEYQELRRKILAEL